METMQVLSKGGELLDVEIKRKRYLHKADRMIDHDMISVLSELKPCELKILMAMWLKCDMDNFFHSKKPIGNISRRWKSVAIKSLIEKDLIKTAHMTTGKRTIHKGWMVNPFYFRKVKDSEKYLMLYSNYNLGLSDVPIVRNQDEIITKQMEE